MGNISNGQQEDQEDDSPANFIVFQLLTLLEKPLLSLSAKIASGRSSWFNPRDLLGNLTLYDLPLSPCLAGLSNQFYTYVLLTLLISFEYYTILMNF